MKKLTTLIAIVCLFTAAAHAETAQYDFELIIFEDVSNRYASSEQWEHVLLDPAEELITVADMPSEKSDNQEAGADTSITPIKSIGLDRYASKLKANKRYKVLVHKAWRQAGLADEEAINIPIDSRPVNNLSGTVTDRGTGPQSMDANSIHGSIRIVLGRYLHLYTDLIYQQPDQATGPNLYGQDSARFKMYPINFHRRMRSKELHYLDHPMVGILVLAMPVEKRESAEDQT